MDTSPRPAVFSPRLAYQLRLVAASVLWYAALAIGLLRHAPFPLPPVSLLGLTLAPAALGWAALVLAALLFPEYDDKAVQRAWLISLPLLLALLVS
ncbi:hypothetical protein HNQ93_004097 [Hymenobacter luteus]|uniref:Uncharacterized protein n=3 Tax=Hymenobacter TaxID=89966 RepID=A0A428J0B6_9BACT|nr:MULTISPECIES: hypothetical protein [Hymenobacter]MBB4603428.1 hypothetical protein [Hymenobacter latericoloratus]MBB6061218.1 hypothetical protein [Hymenobacter luteus]RSK25002.1 hypothetical protein EI290_18435 [Hymenobacter metallilatus]